MVDIFVVSLI